MKSKLLQNIWILFFGISISMGAQDLLSKLDKELNENSLKALPAFKTTRISIGHSVETRPAGSLEIAAVNRFWNIPNQQTQRFLADEVNTRFSLEYSISDRLTIGGGTSTFDGLWDGFVKYRLVYQSADSKKSPFSITLFQNISYNDGEFSDQLYAAAAGQSITAYTTQVLIARKFNPNLSIQVTPTLVQRSDVVWASDPKTQFAVGLGFRHKISKHASIVSEYYYVANPIESRNTYDAFAVGLNWEVSDLMLQFNITNARNVVEDAFITRTTNNFNFHDGNFHFGFGATLVLHFKENKLD